MFLLSSDGRHTDGDGPFVEFFGLTGYYFCDLFFLAIEYIARQGRMSETMARRKFWQIISAVEYCHQRQIVHRDLKVNHTLDSSTLLNLFRLSDIVFPPFF